MITKSEEEQLMEDAIGNKIDDYLTKPGNPSQILLVCKKKLEKNKITGERISRDYAVEFNQIARQLLSPMDWRDWIDIHSRLSEWDVELFHIPIWGSSKPCRIKNAHAHRIRPLCRAQLFEWIHSSDRP
jgi:response regulator RpfG family c-di-GMP phosphodiesterase